MAISPRTVWEVRTTGNDVNGGGFVFKSTGTDYSQQASPQVSVTDAVANGTTTITSATATFTSAMVGNIMYLQGGTGSLAITRREIVTFTNSTTVVVDATVATGTGITMNIGGALNSLGEAVRSATSYNSIYILSGTYTLSTSSSNVASGILLPAQSPLNIYGRGTSRSDTTLKPVIYAGSITSVSVIKPTGNYCYIENLEINGASGTSVKGFENGAGAFYTYLRGCIARNCPGDGFAVANRMHIMDCQSYNNKFGFIFGNDSSASWCYASGNSSTGFYVRAGSVARFCVSEHNLADGMLVENYGGFLINCVSVANSGVGFKNDGTNQYNYPYAINCIAKDNTTYGYSQLTGSSGYTINCTAQNNTTAAFNNVLYQEGTVTITGDPFSGLSTGNFALDNTTNEGASLRSIAWPSGLYGNRTANYEDIGAVRHQDASSGETITLF